MDCSSWLWALSVRVIYHDALSLGSYARFELTEHHCQVIDKEFVLDIIWTVFQVCLSISKPLPQAFDIRSPDLWALVE